MILAGGFACLFAACGSVDPSKPTPPSGDAGSNGDVAGAPGMNDGGTPSSGGSDAQAGATNESGAAGAGVAGAPQVELPEGPLLPWAVGNTWTYQVTKGVAVSQKTMTIGEVEEVGGTGPNATKLANHMTTVKGADENDHTESWQAPDENHPDRIVRYREQSFATPNGALELEERWAPSKLHIDGSAEHTAAGASWLEKYSETKLAVGLPPTTHAVSETWTVLSNDETITVPAGSFEHAIHLKKVGDGSSKEYWYLRGVGKLKETGAQTEELVDYQLSEVP